MTPQEALHKVVRIVGSQSRLAREIGTKALLAGAGALLLYWTISAVKLVLSARGINPPCMSMQHGGFFWFF